MAAYAAQIDRMDQNIGRLMARIRAMGEEDNTLVIFLADNGGSAEPIAADFRGRAGKVRTAAGKLVRFGNVPSIDPGPADTFQSYGAAWANVSNTPFRLYKTMVHEGGISTPLIARWPAGGSALNRVLPQVGHVIDLMPTILDAARAEYPKRHANHDIQPAEGVSLLPAVRGQLVPRTAPIFWEHLGNRAVREGDWKLVARRSEPWELYNIAEDRCEMRDLAPKSPDRVAHLEAAYNTWAWRANVLPLEEIDK